MTNEPIDPAALQPVLLAWTSILGSYETIHAMLKAFQPLLTQAVPDKASQLFTAKALEDLERGSFIVKRLNPGVVTPGADWKNDLSALDSIATDLEPTANGLVDLIVEADVPSTGLTMLKDAIPQLAQALGSYRSTRESL